MDREESLKQWREAKLGLLIRWGLFSLIDQDEWVMYREQIPVREYEKLAERFASDSFALEAWVQLAEEAGMKYIVATAKGYDGFSLFRTSVSSFCSAPSASSGTDVLERLAVACRNSGLRLGLRYAHARDWRHPMAQSIEEGPDGRLTNRGNFWDYPRESRKDLQKYIDELVIPQLRELLERYGNVLTVRFDAPSLIRPDQAEQIRRAVREARPDCLIGGELSSDVEEDYRSVRWEECFADESKAWEAVTDGQSVRWDETARRLADAVSRNGNLLVEVRPDGRGRIPEGVRRSLLRLGAWLRENGEAIYGASGSPFPAAPSWGRVTRGNGRLYLIVTDPAARTATLTGLRTRTRACTALASGRALPFEERHEEAEDRHVLIVRLTGLEGSIRVVRVETEGEIEVSGRLGPDGDDRIVLPDACAERQEDCVRWQFHVDRPGKYLLSVAARPVGAPVDGEEELQLEVDGSMYVMLAANVFAADGDALPAAQMFLQAGRHTLDASVVGRRIGEGRTVRLECILSMA